MNDIFGILQTQDNARISKSNNYNHMNGSVVASEKNRTNKLILIMKHNFHLIYLNFIDSNNNQYKIHLNLRQGIQTYVQIGESTVPLATWLNLTLHISYIFYTMILKR